DLEIRRHMDHEEHWQKKYLICRIQWLLIRLQMHLLIKVGKFWLQILGHQFQNKILWNFLEMLGYKKCCNAQIGTAVIEFYDVNDAAQACEIYHNRLLDGQPMKCYIQSNAYSHRVSVSERLGERIQSSSVPLSSSFSSNPRSRYNPRDVRFTVKLT
ncbi:RRM domain-containing protein, partial [Trichonephila clavata]